MEKLIKDLNALEGKIVFDSGPVALACEEVLLSRRSGLRNGMVFLSQEMNEYASNGAHRMALALDVVQLQHMAMRAGFSSANSVLARCGDEYARHNGKFIELGMAYARQLHLIPEQE